MSDKITLPGLSDDDDRTLTRLLTQLDEKQPRNLLRTAHYDGKHAARVTSMLPPQYHSLGIVLGWSAKAVDILARRCNLDDFVWPDGDLRALGSREVWDGNDLSTEVSSGIISAFMHGVAFLVNTVGDERQGEPRGLIHVKDATSATGTWNARARRLDDLLSITARDDDAKPSGLVLYLPGRTVIAEKDSSGWSVQQQEHPWGVPAEPLVYKPRVGRPFGSSRISRPVMSLHNQAVREVIRLEGHMDVYSYPEMWLLGADDGIFKNTDGSMRSPWQVMLGRIKAIPDDDTAAEPRADVRQFSAASPEPHLSALNAFAKLFARETGLPDTAVAITDVANPTSAESYDASQYELIAEAEGATDDFTRPMRRSFARSLAMHNGYRAVPAEWHSIDAKWRDVRYQSRAAMADAGMKQLAAVPWLGETEVGLELIGLDRQQIERVLPELRRRRGAGVLDALRASLTTEVDDGRPGDAGA